MSDKINHQSGLASETRIYNFPGIIYKILIDIEIFLSRYSNTILFIIYYYDIKLIQIIMMYL